MCENINNIPENEIPETEATAEVFTAPNNYLDFIVEDDVAEPKKRFSVTKLLAMIFGIISGLALLYYAVEFFNANRMQIEQYTQMGIQLPKISYVTIYLSVALLFGLLLFGLLRRGLLLFGLLLFFGARFSFGALALKFFEACKSYLTDKRAAVRVTRNDQTGFVSRQSDHSNTENVFSQSCVSVESVRFDCAVVGRFPKSITKNSQLFAQDRKIVCAFFSVFVQLLQFLPFH